MLTSMDLMKRGTVAFALVHCLCPQVSAMKPITNESVIGLDKIKTKCTTHKYAIERKDAMVNRIKCVRNYILDSARYEGIIELCDVCSRSFDNIKSRRGDLSQFEAGIFDLFRFRDMVLDESFVSYTPGTELAVKRQKEMRDLYGSFQQKLQRLNELLAEYKEEKPDSNIWREELRFERQVKEPISLRPVQARFMGSAFARIDDDCFDTMVADLNKAIGKIDKIIDDFRAYIQDAEACIELSHNVETLIRLNRLWCCGCEYAENKEELDGLIKEFGQNKIDDLKNKLDAINRKVGWWKYWIR